MDSRIQIELHGGLKGVSQQVRKEDADDQADIDGGNRLDPLPGSESVNDDDDDRRQHDAEEQHVGIGELILADDRRRPDAKAGNHEHENGPDQYKKHGKLPRSDFVGRAAERGKNDERERISSPRAGRSRSSSASPFVATQFL